MPRGIPNDQSVKQALHHPVNQPAKEVHTSDTAVVELPPVDLGLDKELVRERIVIPPAGAMDKIYVDALQFAEQAVTVIINKGTEKFAPDFIACWCNGEGAEVFLRGKWVKMGWLPVNTRLITKRKYVEILVRSKQTSYTTEHDQESRRDDAYVDNKAMPSTSRKVQLSVIGDTNPKGAEWLMNLMNEQE